MSPLKMDALTSEDVKTFVEQITDEQARAAIDKNRNADFTCVLPEVGRIHVNVFRERGSLSVAIRCIPDTVPSIDELNLSAVVKEIAQVERGLLLVTGTTGSGKFTTLAAMMDFVNHHRHCRIITVEDPVEFIHQLDKSLIAQCEVGTDASGFLPSLREAMRRSGCHSGGGVQRLGNHDHGAASRRHRSCRLQHGPHDHGLPGGATYDCAFSGQRARTSAQPTGVQSRSGDQPKISLNPRWQWAGARAGDSAQHAGGEETDLGRKSRHIPPSPGQPRKCNAVVRPAPMRTVRGQGHPRHRSHEPGQAVSLAMGGFSTAGGGLVR